MITSCTEGSLSTEPQNSLVVLADCTVALLALLRRERRRVPSAAPEPLLLAVPLELLERLRPFEVFIRFSCDLRVRVG